MLQPNDIQPCFVPLVSTKNIPSSPKVMLIHYNNNTSISTDVLSSTSDLNSVSNERYAVKEDIYVCTFCQVFAPHLETVTSHISLVHSESLLPGTHPEDFVSKLHSLDKNLQKKKSKRGRPKKQQVESIVSESPKMKIDNPVPDSEGLFWCKTCLKHFRKARQLTQHICLEPDKEVSSEEESVLLDEDEEFKTHMSLDLTPWSKNRKNRKLKENTADEVNAKLSSTEELNNHIADNRILPNWRQDPTYIPVFDNEKEKAAFEEHLKSIDYSYVDTMYKAVEKDKSKYGTNVSYSCDFCKKSFKALSYVRAHCLIHTDLKPFSCPKCTYSANSSGSLYFHMRKHTGNGFWCSYCDYKCLKKSHLLDHEATHLAQYQTCELCKNSYKTFKSLLSHVRKYHDYPNGKKYLKSLTHKQNKFSCNICNKKFKTLNILKKHNHACHKSIPPSDSTPAEENTSEQSSLTINNEISNVQLSMDDTTIVEVPAINLQCNSMQTKDHLAEMVLNDFLQHQQQSQDIIYQNVFSQANENMISSSSSDLLGDLQTEAMAERLATTETSILEECQKTLDLDILKECLQSSGFSNDCEEFSLIPNISRKHSLQNTSENNSDVANHLSEISEDKFEEPKSVEIKLFEKCQRAPAYVCCVCKSIFICPSTLKVHLREHVISTITSLMDQTEEQQFENTPTKITEASSELDVCDILQDSSESFDKELEKLYMSSLHLMYYLPEVSVVLENDPALFDSMLDDISNFPMNDNPSQDLNEKVEEENVLKLFS